MTPEREVDLILSDCFFAVGQAVSTCKHIEYEAIVWLRNRYHSKFHRAITAFEHAWPEDRDRLMAVSRYLALRAVHHAGDGDAIDARCVTRASAEVEEGCRMKAAEGRAAAAALSQSATLPATDEASS